MNCIKIEKYRVVYNKYIIMFKSLGFKKIINHKINPNLFGFDTLPTNNYKTFKYCHTHSKTLFNTNNQSSKLTPHF
jgi:hypothetical protein